MENATIQINNGRINVVDKREPNPLSLSKIQEILHSYYRHNGGKDETLDIMTFVRANRGYNVQKSLKQSGIMTGASHPAQPIQQMPLTQKM